MRGIINAPGRLSALLSSVLIPVILSGCSQTANVAEGVKPKLMSVASAPRLWRAGYTARDKECMMRVMFFESNRSSRDGLTAVGTVVMNRLRSGKYGNSICGIVGAERQFAPGVLTRPMDSKALPDVEAAADAVLKGERNPKVKNAMFFHTAGLKFPYKNMHYMVVAGGNAFYEKRNRNGDPVVLPPEQPVMMAQADIPPEPQKVQTGEPSVSPRDDVPVALAMAEAPASGRSAMTAIDRTARPAVTRMDDGWIAPPPGAPDAAAQSASASGETQSFDVDEQKASAIGQMILEQ